MTRKYFAGAASAVTLDGAIGASGETTIDTNGSTGWPSTGPYVMVIDRGLESEEKILIASRSGNTHTISSRGYDSTTAIAHANGAAVEHCIDANTIDEANAHVNDTTRDDHTQYLTPGRHGVNSLHLFGGALAVPGAPAAIGITANSGSGTAPAREDHVHTIGPEAIDQSAMFAAGVVDNNAIGEDAVDTINILDDAVEQDQLADDSVGTDQIIAAAVTETELAASVAGAGLTGGAGSALAVVVDDSTLEIATDTVRVKDGGITPAKLQVVPACSAYRAATQSISHATWEAVSLTAEDFDFSTAMHDNSTNATRITIPAGWGGKYMVIATCEIDNTSVTGTTAYAGIGVNVNAFSSSPTYIGQRIPIANDNYDIMLTMSQIIELAAGDYVQLYIWHASGSNARFAQNARLQVRYLQP